MSRRCKFCVFPVAPGRTRNGNPYDTCCRTCAVTNGRGGHCRTCVGNGRVVAPRRRCRVLGCTSCQLGRTHYCRVCGDTDSTHRSSNCPMLLASNIVHPGQRGDTRHSVGVYVIWRENPHSEKRVLVHRRSAQQRHGAGLVSVPGGLVTAGGTFRDSAVRELQEEAGISVRQSDLVKVIAHNRFGTPTCCGMMQRVVYRVEFTGPMPRLNGPDRQHAWEIDPNWGGGDAGVGLSAGAGFGHRWATAEELRLMHHTAADDSLWFPGGHGDIEISLALGASPPLHIWT